MTWNELLNTPSEETPYCHKGKYYKVTDIKSPLFSQTLRAEGIKSHQGKTVGVCLDHGDGTGSTSFYSWQLCEVAKPLTLEQQNYYNEVYHEGYQQAMKEVRESQL